MPVTQTAREKALTFAEYGRETAAVIDDAIAALNPPDAELLTIYAHRIRTCSQVSNLWTATDLHNQDGEAFNGSGRFWHCGHKLCNYCIAKISHGQRRVLRKVLLNLKLRVGYDLRFLTLTIPNIGLPCFEARKIFNHAWSLFRKRKFFLEHIRGGCKNEEFKLTAAGYHYHAHAIVECKSTTFSDLRSDWTHCVTTAFGHFNTPVEIRTSDRQCIANLEKIDTFEHAINECAKYITKSDSWKNIPPTDLLDFCRVRRFPRMFELFGTFADERRLILKATQEARAAFRLSLLPDYIRSQDGLEDVLANLDIVHTRCLSDGETADTWRDKVINNGAVKYLDHLNREIAATEQIRAILLQKRFHAAQFFRIRHSGGSPYVHVINKLEQLADTKGHRIKNMRHKLFRDEAAAL